MISIPTRAAEFRETFVQQRWITDGAMATMLFARGAFGFGIPIGIHLGGHMERFVWPVDGGTGEFRFGAEGLLGGYLLLTGESGLSQVEQDFLGSSGRDTMRLALAQSLDFFRVYEPHVISAEQCSRCMRRLAAGRVLRFTAITSLARWGDWGALPELMRLADATVPETLRPPS